VTHSRRILFSSSSDVVFFADVSIRLSISVISSSVKVSSN